jgi:hypothetical protein
MHESLIQVEYVKHSGVNVNNGFMPQINSDIFTKQKLLITIETSGDSN